MVARLGGEEFAALLPFATAENAFTFANKMRQAVKNSKFMYKGKRIDITISGGVAQRKDAKDIKDLYKKADRLLYKAKNSGRDNIQK